MQGLRNYIGGSWQEPVLDLGMLRCDASSGEQIGTQRACSEAQIDEAILAAGNAARDSGWCELSPAQRAEMLDRVAAELDSRTRAIARSDAIETGVIVATTSRVAGICAAAFRAAATHLRGDTTGAVLDGPCGALEVDRLPLGVALLIAPWNAPSGIACHKLASSLAAGCPSILKPSEWAPGSCQLIADAVAAAELPDGVFQLLHGGGETGARLVADTGIAAVSFTGGLAGGRAVAAACAAGIKPVQLELGGNNALVVLDDADLETAADGVVTGLITLNGQWCRAVGRLLVHESLQEKLLAAVGERMSTLRIGAALDPHAEMGPLVHEGHRQHVATAVDALAATGGKVLQTTSLPDLGGWFYPPTLVSDVDFDLSREEIFGPVCTVHSFSDDREACRLANDTPFGLAAYVFGSEPRAWTVARTMRCGIVKINAVSMLNLNPAAPRPAWGLSGIGNEGTGETLEFFRGSRVIGVAAAGGPS